MQEHSESEPNEKHETGMEMPAFAFLIALGIICFTILGIVSLITGNPIIKG